jgi:hypothetical protein
MEGNMMSKVSHDYDKLRGYSQGVRDGAKNDFNPPHQKGLLGSMIEGYSKEEIANRDAYREGWQRGYDKRK